MVPSTRRRAALFTAALTPHALWLSGCVSYEPRPPEAVPFMDRAATAGTAPYIFLQRNFDPNYYAASEGAHKSHFSVARRVLGHGLMGLLLSPIWFVIPFESLSAYSANKKMAWLLLGEHDVTGSSYR